MGYSWQCNRILVKCSILFSLLECRRAPLSQKKLILEQPLLEPFSPTIDGQIWFSSNPVSLRHSCGMPIGETRTPLCTIKAEKTRLILHAGSPLRGRLKELCVNGPNYTLTRGVRLLKSGAGKAEGRCEACLLIYEGICCKEERPIILTSQQGKFREYLGQALGESF